MSAAIFPTDNIRSAFAFVFGISLITGAINGRQVGGSSSVSASQPGA
jgi:hypothetical protein